MTDVNLMDLLHKAYPGRTDEEIAPMGLIYTGMNWKQDYRCCDVPIYEGVKLTTCTTEATYWFYLDWLADYLYNLKGTIIEEQKGLCKYMATMQPKDAAIMLGSQLGIYCGELNCITLSIENAESFEEHWISVFDMVKDSEEFQEDPEGTKENEREFFLQAREEFEEKNRFCPDIGHADVGYRVPLSIVLQRIDDHDERVKILDIFYLNFNTYLAK